MCEEVFQDILKSYVSFGQGLYGSNGEKIGEATERTSSIVKFGETAFEGGL